MATDRNPSLAAVHGFDPANEDRTPTGVRNWLIWDGKSECWWGPNRGGYWKSLEHAGLYTEAEAKAQQAASERTRDRKDVAVPLSSRREAIERLYQALHAGDDPPPRPAGW